LNSAAFNGATLVGPLVGGVLIIPFGVGGLMLINAISYLAIVAALVLMRPQPVIDYGPRLSLLESIREGLSFIRGDAVLRWVVLLSIATALFTRPYIQLLPAEAQLLGVGAIELSWLLAASGAGALVGALVTMLFVGLTSLAVMVYLGMANTLMQTRAPDSLRGRVMSVQTMVFIGFMPLGQMVLGSVGTLVGINNAFLVGGVIVALLAGYAALRVSALREAVATARPGPATTS